MQKAVVLLGKGSASARSTYGLKNRQISMEQGSSREQGTRSKRDRYCLLDDHSVRVHSSRAMYRLMSRHYAYPYFILAIFSLFSSSYRHL